MRKTVNDIVISVACAFALTPLSWESPKSGSKNIYFDEQKCLIKIYAYNNWERNEIFNLFVEELEKNNYQFSKEIRRDEIFISIYS